jgi:hypothetical protein
LLLNRISQFERICSLLHSAFESSPSLRTPLALDEVSHLVAAES